jgi:hypothetical protein
MSNVFTPGPTPNTVRDADGRVRTVPDGWILLPPGDAALTRRVKEAGNHYLVQEKKGRKVFSRGIWAPAATIERIRADLEAERSTESYAKKKAADARRRDQAQVEYVEDFQAAVLAFLPFHGNYADLANRLARIRVRQDRGQEIVGAGKRLRLAFEVYLPVFVEARQIGRHAHIENGVELFAGRTAEVQLDQSIHLIGGIYLIAVERRLQVGQFVGVGFFAQDRGAVVVREGRLNHFRRVHKIQHENIVLLRIRGLPHE